MNLGLRLKGVKGEGLRAKPVLLRPWPYSIVYTKPYSSLKGTPKSLILSHIAPLKEPLNPL